MPSPSTPQTIHTSLGGQDFIDTTGCVLAHVTNKGVIYKLPIPLANTATHISVDLAREEHYNVHLLRKEIAPLTDLRCFRWVHLRDLSGLFTQLICPPLKRPDPIQ